MIDARATALAFVAILAASTAQARSVSIVHDAASPQASYAARKLGDALRERGYEVRSAERGAAGFAVRLGIHPERLPAEAFALTPSRKALAIEGGDARGLVYGALAVAETLRNGTRLEEIRERREAPRLEFRGVKFNLPGTPTGPARRSTSTAPRRATSGSGRPFST